MKQIFLFLLALLLCQSTYTQNSTLSAHPGIKQKLRHSFSPLDKTQVPGGYLLNQVVPFVSPSIYKGNVQDTALCSNTQWLMLYNMFRAAYVGQSGNLPDPTTTVLPAFRADPSDTINIAVLALQYGAIHDSAMTHNLISKQGDQFFDVPNRQSSPYSGSVCYVATALNEVANSLTPKIFFPIDFHYSNLNQQNVQYELDAADGLGFRPFQPGSLLNLNYPHGGRKTITLKRTFSGQFSYLYLTVSVPEVVLPTASLGAGPYYNEDNPDEIITVSGAPYLGQSNELTLNIFYGCGDKKLRKPLIFVEGYEEPALSLGDKGLVSTWQKTLFLQRIRKVFNNPNFPLVSGERTMEKTLFEAGYDLIYVDYKTLSPDYIQRNAFAMEAALNAINARKHASGSDYENILIGGSMGGLVCKYALLNMERTNRKHECQVFISFDSPLSGANIPLGSQCLFKFLETVTYDFVDPDDLPPMVLSAFGALDRPGVKQMLIQRLVKVPNPTPTFPDIYIPVRSPEYTALMAEIAGMGTLKVKHIAVSNGSNNTSLLENEVGPGGILNDVSIEGEGWAIGGPLPLPIIFAATGKAKFEWQSWAEDNYTLNQVFRGKLKISAGFLINVPLYSYEVNVSATAIPLSTMPGGNSLLGMIPSYLPGYIRAGASGSSISGTPLSFILPPNTYPLTTLSASQFPQLPIPFWFYATGSATLNVNAPLVRHTTFIPTFSSRGLPLPTSVPAIGTPLPCITSDCSTPNARWVNENTDAPEWNQDHVFLDDRIANILLGLVNPKLLDPGFGVPSTISTYYNVADPAIKNIGGVTVKSGGKLSINNNGATGYGLGLNPPQASRNPFTAYVEGCNGSVLTVENGGKLFIGADNQTRTGHVLALNGSLVHLHKGSYLAALGNASSLTIDKKSTLIIEKDALIDLQPYNSKIRIEGTLRINGDFKFFGDGFFEFGPDAILEYGPDVQEWTLKGRGKGRRFMRLEGNLRIPVGKGMVVESGLVEHDVKGVFDAVSNSYLTGLGVVFDGSKGRALAAVKTSFAAKMWMSNCDFLAFLDAVTAEWTPNVNIIDCKFLGNSFYGLRHVGPGMTANILRSTFDGREQTPDGKPFGYRGAIFEHTKTVRIFDSYFRNMHNGEVGVVSTRKAIENPGQPANAGVELANVAICDVRRSYFLNNDVGIYNPVHTNPETSAQEVLPSNLFVDKSYFTENGAGIFMLGDENGGSVVSTCCVYYDNQFGISGLDCRLGIDAYNNASDPSAQLRSNHFVIPGLSAASTTGKLYLDMCYAATDPVVLGAHLIRGNAWTHGSNPDPDPTKYLKISFDCGANVPNIRYIPMMSSGGVAELCGLSEFSEDPVDYVGGYNDDSKCEVNTSLAGSPFIHNQYALAYFKLIVAENLDEALPHFEEISGHYENGNFSSTYSDICRQFASISWSIVHATGQEDFLRSSGKPYEPGAQPAEFTIYPNPVSNRAVLRLPDYPCTIELSDIHGNLIQTVHATYETVLDTHLLNSGLYFVKCAATDGSRRSQTQKLLVQKL